MTTARTVKQIEAYRIGSARSHVIRLTLGKTELARAGFFGGEDVEIVAGKGQITIRSVQAQKKSFPSP